MILAESEKKTYKVTFKENDRTKACLENFLSWNQKMGKTISTEFPFRVPLDAEKDIHFNGIIDRVIEGNDGGYLVIDYKTSKREKKKNDLLTDKQMMGYAYAIHTTYNIPFDKIWCAHYYPLTNNFVTVRFSKFQIFKWKAKEIDTVWRIRKRTKDEFPAHQNIFCDYCEFQPLCPKFHSESVVKIRIEECKKIAQKIRDDKKLVEEQSLVSEQVRNVDNHGEDYKDPNMDQSIVCSGL